MFIVVIFAVAVVVLLTLLLAHTHDERTKVVGSMCVVIGICMYGSPLTIMVRNFLLFSTCHMCTHNLE